MAQKILTITVNFKTSMRPEDIQLRYILSDTIEDRNLGTIINEGTGQNYVDVSLIVEENENAEDDINSVLQSLGLLEQSKLVWEELEE